MERTSYAIVVLEVKINQDFPNEITFENERGRYLIQSIVYK